jgi:hypothetical protein
MNTAPTHQVEALEPHLLRLQLLRLQQVQDHAAHSILRVEVQHLQHKVLQAQHR